MLGPAIAIALPLALAIRSSVWSALPACLSVSRKFPRFFFFAFCLFSFSPTSTPSPPFFVLDSE